MDDLEKAKIDLVKYLEANPHLWELQKELNSAMDSVGDDTYKRLQVYYFFLHHNLCILKEEFGKLQKLLKYDDKT